MTKKLTIMTFLVLLLTVAFFPVQAMSKEESGSSVQLIIHKLLFANGEQPEETMNDGTEGTLLTDYEGLNDVTFDVYDVTEHFYQLRKTGLSVEDAQDRLAGETPDSSPVATELTETREGEQGIAIFDLPAKDQRNRDAVFLIVESAAPEYVKQRSKNLVVVLPMVHAGQALRQVHLYPKNETVPYEEPPFEKTVLDNNQGMLAGEKVSYQLCVTLPSTFSNYSRFVIEDRADKGLAFESGSLKIMIGDKPLTEGVKVESAERGFTAVFDLAVLQQYAAQKMTLTYQMRLGMSAVPDQQIENRAVLDVGHDPIIRTGRIRTGGKRFIKVDSENQNDTLANAVFAVKNTRNEYLTFSEEGYVWKKEQTAGLVKLVSGKDGHFEVTGLKDGEYQLQELEAPAGYVLSESPVPFTVEQGSYQEQGKPSTALHVINKKTGDLPQTGEIAGTGLTLLGMICMSGVWLMYKKEKRGNK